MFVSGVANLSQDKNHTQPVKISCSKTCVSETKNFVNSIYYAYSDDIFLFFFSTECKNHILRNFDRKS